MKLHLPSALRKALLLALAAVSATLGIQSATASLIFDGVGIQTYADFGQNCGRYVAGEVNDMLQAIRDKEGGIVIRYVGGAWKDETYTISQEQGMIDFSSASTNPVDTAVGYGFLATVAHNGVLSPTYSGLEVGDQNAIRYNSIDFRRGAPFHMESNTDYKMARLNKLVTDVQPSEFYSGENPSELNGEYLYRTGSGAVDLGWVDENGNWSGTQSMDLPYSFATGGIVTIEWAEGTHKDATDGNFGIFHHFNNNIYTEITGRDFRTKELIDTPNPLPYRVRSGDSGSPTWVYNEEAGAYQYISSGQSGATYFSQDRGDLKWSEYTKTRFNVTANLGSGDHTVTINPVTRTGETVSGEGEGVEVSTTLHYGSMQFTDASGTLQTKEFVGIEKGKHTWLNLSPVKDQVNWFHYGDEYFNVSKYSTEGKEFCFADMFETNTLAFEAGDGDVYDIQLQDNVDLGVGFVLLSKGENYTGPANFRLKSDNYVLDSAGFAIDEGVTLELDMANPDNRMTEWRKAGAGNLVLTGTRDTNALLNVGGSGTVTLAHTNDSYAAYNVLASSGSTLVVNDLKQVYRDVTLGAGGATLDLNGNNFTWNNSATPDGSGFKSLHLLVEKDVVTNRASQAIQITIQNPGEEAFVGAFKDTTEGAINVVYEGDAEKTWVMNTVFTDLQNNAASSFTVQQGSVALQGINTVHARQLLGRRDVNYFDWHYADAKMDVVVKEGAEFTLGSHARLKGNVTVEEGGVFTMKECTTHQYEYMEGGVIMDDTYAYREYIGLHGDINLVGEDSTFNVQFTPQNYYEDTDSESVYEGRITGSGGMLVDTAGGSLKLTNDQNDFTGFKELMRGTLVATSKAALGDTDTGWGWTIYEAGVLQVTGSGLDELLPGIDGFSNGVLALTQNETGGTPDLSEHQDLIIGAVGDIQFGVKGTQEELDSNANGEWHLGGGGGNLYVNYVLNDADGVLVLGNQYTTGRVILTNSGNHFSSIELKGGVTLSYETAEALGGATLSLNYGNRILGDKLLINQLTRESNGVVLIDNLSDETIDLSDHGDLSLAADKKTTFTGSINLGENDTYRFGGGAGHLILDTDLTDGPGGAKRNILVDAQFFTPAYSDDGDFSSAGVVELTRVSQATGTVTVQGYDAAQNPDPDDPLYIWNHFSTATLQLSVDNALAHAESILLKDGGFIDINGTKQTFHSLINDYEEAILDTYGIIDYSEEQSGELVLNVEDESLWSPLFCNLAVPTLTKTGEGALEMVSVNESSLFTINDGTVYVYDELALNSRGVTRVEESGVLDVSDLGEALKNKTIELNNGGTMRVGSNAISGSISVNGGTGTLDANGGTANLDATIGAAQDATLVLNNGSFNLKAAQNNTEGGTINLQGGALSLNNANGVSIGGTLKVSGNATLNTTVNGVTHQLDRLNVENGANLSISGNNRSSVWSIHALDGSGNVTWQPGNNADARLVLLGEGSFSGTLTVAGRTNPQSAPGLVLADDLAVQHATISLQDNASVALSTANTHIAGLTGNASSAVYAYESAAGTTLTITGSGTYTHSGTIGTSSAPMNIVMEGTGSQTFSGTVNAVDVSALKGTLSLQGNNILIAGDVTVARGATLSVEKNLVLNSGQILRTAGVTGNAGVVNGTVTFNGGGLSFDAAGLNGQTAALKFNGGSHTDNLDVNFTNTSYLKSNTTLTLTEGYGWNAGKLNATGLDYLTATFTTDGSLLKVSFTEKSGNRIWDGTNQQNTWSSSAFGQGSELSSKDTAVFNDSAENTNVQVSGNVTSKALLFDNSKEYTVNTTGGATLSAGQVDLKGSGDVTLGAGVSITEAVEIAEGSTLVLQDTDTLGASAKVNGAGKIALDSEAPASLDGNLTHIGCVEVRSGTLSVGQTLNADDMVVSSDADLHATTGSILANNATVHSSGTLEVTIGSGDANLDNAVAAGVDGTAGTFVKEGAGTLSVSKSLVADTVRVNDGSLKTSNKAIVPGFLETTKLLEVNSGATAYIGGDAYTIPDRAVTTVMVVDGGRLELAIAQNTTRTVAGNLTVKNGGTLKKVDGGLRFTGTTTLGSSSQDQVTLAGNWGKSGTIFDGLVKGEGKVTLAKGNSVEKFTFNNGDNTFSGEIEANAGTQLVAGHQTALATASNINLNGGSLVLAANEVDVKKLSGNGVLDVNATAELPSATLNVEEGNFSGTVGGNISITKSGSGTFALTGASSQFNGDLYVKEGTMSLGGSALGILGSTSSVTVKSGAAFQLDGDANVVGPMDIQGTLSLGGDISSRDSVQLAATSSLVGGSHTLKANSLVIEGVGGTNVQAAASQTLSASSSLTMFGDPSKSVTLQADAEAMIYVVNNVQDATLAGDSLTINLSGLGQTPEPGQWMGITLGGDLHTSSIGTGLLVECIIGEGQKMQGYYLGTPGGNLDCVYFTAEEIVSKDLIWDNATKNSNWSTSQNDKNWHAPDAADGSSYFTTGANVQFNSGAHTVALQNDITAGNATLESGAVVAIKGNNHEQSFNNVTIAKNASLSFDENCTTTIGGTLALDGTLNNDGDLSIVEGTVSADATGVLAGAGETTLSGTILNAGTLVLDNAKVIGVEVSAITGNVVINGGTLSGTMELGAQNAKVFVENVFTLGEGANYTILGELVLDALHPENIVYIGAERDWENNGFIGYAEVRAYTETTNALVLDDARVSYKGLSCSFEDGLFICNEADYTTFYVNVGELGPETYKDAMEAAEKYGAAGELFKNVRLAAGTGFEMNSLGAKLDKVTVDAGDSAAQLDISQDATIGTVEMGADLSITGKAALELGSVQAAASETLTVNGPAVTVTGSMQDFHGSVDVEGGILNIMNAASVDVKDVAIGANATLGVYNGGTATADTEHESTLTIKNTQSLTAKGAGAKLNANLVMDGGSTLDVSATGGIGLLMGSEVTLNMGVNLSTADLANVMGLMQGESYILFNGVDSLTLGQTTYTEAITPETKVDAAKWFNGLAAESYYVVYDGSNVGHVAIFSATPEPTTSTLSLLALAALAARRRRK